MAELISGDFLQRVNSLMEENMQTLFMKIFEIAREDAIITAYNLWVDGRPFHPGNFSSATHIL